MMTDRSFWMEAEWGSRLETPEAIAARYLQTVDALRALNPLLDDWIWGDYQELWESEAESGTYPFADVRPRMAQAVERNLGGTEDEEPSLYCGYYLMSNTERAGPGSLVNLGGKVGAKPGGGSWVTAFTNSVDVEVGPKPDPSLTTFAFWRAVTLLAAETWEASWAEVSPGDIQSMWDKAPCACRCAWMSYVSPRFAPLIAPPPGIIAEHRPNGGLFMAATTDTFRTADPAHRAAAEAINASLAPINALPFPIDDLYQ